MTIATSIAAQIGKIGENPALYMLGVALAVLIIH